MADCSHCHAHSGLGFRSSEWQALGLAVEGGPGTRLTQVLVFTESRLVFRRKVSLGTSVEILYVRRKLRNARSPKGRSALSVRELFAEHRFFFAER